MYHYVYLLTFDNGMKYVGAHSTKLEPALDTRYLGSGKGLPVLRNCKKEILAEFPTRGEAISYEIECIDKWNAVESPEFYNLRRSTNDKHGSKLSKEHRKSISQRQRGRVRYEYRGKYIGDARTPAQKAADRSNSERNLGVKNPKKGHIGTTNCAFRPWYYITPAGEQVDVLDRTKQEMAAFFGMTERQMVHRFHYTNMHRPCKYTVGNAKGFTFGDLPRPTTEQE